VHRNQSTSARIFQIGLIWLVMILPIGIQAQKTAAKPLSKKEQKKEETGKIVALGPKYKEWLDFVSYIIHDTERKIFLDLTNDRDRDAFISLFWSLRDPTPGTTENEFRIEHQRRVDYANQYFKYDAGRPGWMTDRGRIYIILGEPDSKDKIEVDAVVKPVQLWSYSGKDRPGLPNAFWVLFFKRDEIGEFKVYNPLSDGPFSLLKRRPSMEVDENDPEDVYEEIAEYHPVLAMASVSLIPDEPPGDFRPTLRSELLLGSIYEMPKRMINANYATNFKKYKGVVRVDYTMNYMEVSHSTLLARDEVSGLNFLHFAFLPKTLSIDYNQEKDQYYFNFRVDVALKKGEKSVFSYQKNFSFTEKKDDVEVKYKNGVVIADYFPVAEGEYTLQVLVQNDVKKDFSYFERKIVVKPDQEKTPEIIGPVVSHETKRLGRNAFLPFKFQDIEWTVIVRGEFGRDEELSLLTGVDRKGFAGALQGRIIVEDASDANRWRKEFPFPVIDTLKTPITVQPLGKIPPGHYRARVQVMNDKGTVLKTEESSFMVSLQPTVPHPPVASKITPAENLFLFHHMIGSQYMNLGDSVRAEQSFLKALQINGRAYNVIKEYCTLLFKNKDYDRVLKTALPLQETDATKFDYFSFTGRAYFAKGLYDLAQDALLRANELYDSDIEVLNTLGLTFLKLNRPLDARKVLESSLKVFPDQKPVIELLKKIQ